MALTNLTLMKILKWVGLGIAAALVIILGGIVYVTTILDPNDYIDDITQIIKIETNIDLDIGQVNWSFFPWLGISVEEVSATHPDAVALVKVKQLELRLKVFAAATKKD